jgi:ankyrin repeat protein
MSIFFYIAFSFSLQAQRNLFKSIHKGKTKAVSKYIAKGGDLNVSKELWSYDPIHDKDTSNFFSPMECAALEEHTDILKLLIQHKEKINDYQKHLDNAFAESIASGNMEIIHLLLDAGADINAVCASCYEQAAIQIAMEYAYFDLVEELIKQGANVHVKSNMGRTPLHAVSHFNNVELAKKLIDSGLDVNAQDENGATPLHYAASNGEFEMFKLLEDNGADLNMVENEGFTLMMNAARGGNVEIINYLIEKGISVNSVSDEIWTPLLFACSENNYEAAEALLKRNAFVNVMNKDGETPLLWAIWNGNEELAKLIIERNIDVLETYDYRGPAKENIKNKEFLNYLDKKYQEWESHR